MSFGYPVSINLTNKLCTVVGGGVVAERKVITLLKQEATVIVISPEITEELEGLWEKKSFVWIKENLENEDRLKNSFIVIAATNSRQINHQIATYCNNNNILVNVIDCPEESNFAVNAHFSQGDLMIAVSTNGQSPAIAKKIKNELKQQFGEEYRLWLELLAEARIIAKKTIPDAEIRNQKLKELINIDVLNLIKDKKMEEARERVMKCLLS